MSEEQTVLSLHSLPQPTTAVAAPATAFTSEREKDVQQKVAGYSQRSSLRLADKLKETLSTEEIEHFLQLNAEQMANLRNSVQQEHKDAQDRRVDAENARLQAQTARQQARMRTLQSQISAGGFASPEFRPQQRCSPLLPPLKLNTNIIYRSSV
jgi:FtsZ-binding cell division protein ZapB